VASNEFIGGGREEAEYHPWSRALRVHLVVPEVYVPPCGPGQRLPFARLCVTQSISQFSLDVDPPLLHAVTWSASISSSRQSLALFVVLPAAQSGQFDTPVARAFVVWSS
jgi:hypothetical protein